MQILSSLLFGISASLDALLVGLTFGVRGTRIKLWQNLLISLITLLGTCLFVGPGNRLSLLCPTVLWQWLGSAILILLGIYYIIIFMKDTLQKDHKKTSDAPSASLTPAQVFALSFSLSANNMGIGLSASIAGLSLLPAAIVTLLFSFLFLFLGNHLGNHHVIQLTDKTTNLISGLLLIGLGILELIQ